MGRRRAVALGLVAILLFAGCATVPVTTPQQKGTAGGAAAGAATGAIIGQAIGGKWGIGAALGGVVGGIIGNLIGSHLESKKESTASGGQPPRPEEPVPANAPASGDPTRGELINATAWLVRVWVDPEDPAAPESKEPILLQPRQKAARSLDIGTYRIVATAHAPTQFGERLVGRFDRTIEIEARRPGWFLKFSDAEFR
jgi:Glycine zipper